MSGNADTEALQAQFEELELFATAPEKIPTAKIPFAWQIYFAVKDQSGKTIDQAKALIAGSPTQIAHPLVRVHSACVNGDVFGSLRCDCGTQLNAAMKHLAAEGGVIIYMLDHEGRGLGPEIKARAY